MNIILSHNKKDKTAALDLTKKVYLAEGYLAKDQKESAFDKFIFSPHSKVFIAEDSGAVTGTVSVVNDSGELGLPMDALFKEELRQYRDTGKKIAEITQLAVDKVAGDKYTNLISLELFKKVLQYGIHAEIDYFVIAINPKHDAFYKILGFAEFGNLKYYPSVNNAPALARVLDFKEFLQNKNMPKMFAQMVSEPFDPDFFK